MDDLTESIGQLSTNAKEWKPSSQSNISTQSTYHPTSPHPSSPYGTSAIRHSPPGRNVATGIDRQTPHQSHEWNSERSHDFVPCAPWNNNKSETQPRTVMWGPQTPSTPELYGYVESDAKVPNPGETGPSWEASTIPSGPVPPPASRTLHSLGVSDDLWRYYRDVAMEAQRQMDPTDPRHKAVPPDYFNAYQLDDTTRGSRSSFGYPMSVFKVTGSEDGHLYCLRRVDNVRGVSHKIASAVMERWASATTSNSAGVVIEHPGVVRLYRCFVANRAVFFVHQYIPGARTMRELFMNPNAGGGVPLPEPLLWSCITQLVAVIRAVHGGNLACRTLQLNHILCKTPDGGWGNGNMMDRVRLRINCLGVVDALEFEARKQLRDLQREDMRDLGRIILSLGTGTEITRISDDNTIRSCGVFVGQNYGHEIQNLALSLLTPNANTPNVHEVSRAISNRALDELDLCQTTADRTEAALEAEYESGRALRLLLKLGFVNERPEFGMNRRWTESGDCYVLKLFRDYVFHQADGAGRPVMDLGHVVSALNKLDASDEEKIVLTSRDGKSLLVVSFADVARCLENAFNELLAGSVMPGALQY